MSHTPGPWHQNGCYVFDEFGTLIGSTEALADAPLFAAAPELLAELKALFAVFGQSWPEHVQTDVIAVLQKAEGVTA